MEDNKEKNLNKVFGNNIKTLRLRKMALSQKETARRLGISLRTYTRAEAGQADVSITMARMCSDFFGVTMSSLCGETEEELPTSKIPARERAEKTEEKLRLFSVPVSPVKKPQRTKRKSRSKRKDRKDW